MPHTILVVDDEPANRTLLRAMLTPLDVKVVLAADGEEALARFDEGNIDLVMLDVVMPGADQAVPPGKRRAASPKDGAERARLGFEEAQSRGTKSAAR